VIQIVLLRLLSSFFLALPRVNVLESLAPGQWVTDNIPSAIPFAGIAVGLSYFARAPISSPACTFSPLRQFHCRQIPRHRLPRIRRPWAVRSGVQQATESYMTSHNRSMSGTYTFAREFCSRLTSPLSTQAGSRRHLLTVTMPNRLCAPIALASCEMTS
jgi:hypothetical protein